MFLEKNSNYSLKQPPPSETSTSNEPIDLNAINIFDNKFINNYAILSNGLYVEGGSVINIFNNSFINNSIPYYKYEIHKLTGFSTNIFNIEYDLSTETSLPLESSSLIISLSININLKANVFFNNSAEYKYAAYFGVALTLHKIIPTGQILIENNTFSNFSGIPKNTYTKNLNSLAIISIAYLEDFGFYFSTDLLMPTDYLKKFQMSLIIKKNNFANISIYLLDQRFDFSRYSAFINFFTDFDTSTGIYQNMNGYSKENPKTITTDFKLSIIGMTLSNCKIYDKRPLIDLLFNNIVELSNISFSNVEISEIVSNSDKNYGGFITLYIKDNGYEFTGISFQINIFDISFINCTGTIINIYHPIKLDPFLVDFYFQYLALNIYNINIQNHKTNFTLFCFGLINILNLKNIYIKNLETTYGILYFSSASKKPELALIKIQNITALNIIAYKFGGFSLFSLKNAKINDIFLTNINLLVTEGFREEKASLCLYLQGFTPSISNYTCTNIKINVDRTSLLSSSQYIAICVYLDQVVMDQVTSITNLNCSNYDFFSSLNSSLMSIFLGFVTLSKNVQLQNALFYNFTRLTQGFIMYSSQNIYFYQNTFASITITKNTGYIIAYIFDSSSLTIKYSIIVNNTCSFCLGSLGITDSSLLNLLHSNVSLNKAKDSPAFRIKSANIIIDNSTFIKNTGTLEASIAAIISSNAEIGNSLFQENIGFLNGIVVLDSKLILRKSKFSGNYANLKSSNLYFSLCADEAEISDCQFLNDKSFADRKSINSQKGHFIYANDVQVKILSSFFSYGNSYIGGAIYFSSDSKNLSLTSVYFQNNKADQYGGAIYLDGKGIFNYTYFFNNSCILKGSNIYLETKGILTLNEGFLNNSLGSSIYLEASSLLMNKTTLKGIKNSFNYEYIGIICNICLNLTINNCTFQSFLTRSTFGAALILNGYEGGTDLEDDNFVQFNLANTIIESCISSRGAGIYIKGRNQVTIINSRFFGNKVFSIVLDEESGRGGAIYYSCSNIYCYAIINKGSQFSSNFAEKAGGAHYFAYQPFIFLETTTSYDGNDAVYGPDKASVPMKLELYTSPPAILYEQYINKRILSASNDPYNVITSGSIIYPPIVLKIMDEFGQVVHSDNSSY